MGSFFSDKAGTRDFSSLECGSVYHAIAGTYFLVFFLFLMVIFNIIQLKFFQMALMKSAIISVNRCVWSPDGSMLGKDFFLVTSLHNINRRAFLILLLENPGVAFSKHIVHVYTCDRGKLRQHFEVSIMFSFLGRRNIPCCSVVNLFSSLDRCTCRWGE